MDKKSEGGKLSYLFLSEFLASSHFADLMAFVVAARSAVTTIVFTLTTYALTTPFALFLDRFVGHVVKIVLGMHAGLVTCQRAFETGSARNGRDLTRTFYRRTTDTVTFVAAFHRRRTDFPALFFPGVEVAPGRIGVFHFDAEVLVVLIAALELGDYEGLSLDNGQQSRLLRLGLVAKLVVLLVGGTLEQVDVPFVEDLLLDAGDLPCLDRSWNQRIASGRNCGQGVEAWKT